MQAKQVKIGTVTAKELYNSFVSIVSDLHTVCKLYVEAIDVNPEIKTELIEMGLPSSFLNNSERVGRGELHPNLMLKSGHQFARLRFLPLSEQTKALDAPIEVLCINGDKLKVAIDNLTKQQVDQVMSSSGIRDIPAQKAYIESQKQSLDINKKINPDPVITTQKKYFITRGKLHVGKVSFTKAELLNILQEII